MMLGILWLIGWVACGPVEGAIAPDIVEIDREEYSWTCRDYADWTEVVAQYHACEEVGYLEVRYRLTTGLSGSRSMDEIKPCVYVSSFVFEDEICIQLEDLRVFEEVYY